MVYVSTLEMYGTVLDDSKPLTEDCQGYLDPMQARSSYPMAKRAAECLCHAYSKEHGVRVMTARLAQTFGEGITENDNRVFAQFARSARADEDIVLHTEGKLCRCYCYTADAVEAMKQILANGRQRTWLQLRSELMSRCGIKSQLYAEQCIRFAHSNNYISRTAKENGIALYMLGPVQETTLFSG